MKSRGRGRKLSSMIEKEHIFDILENYEKEKITIGTLGSHSALNIFKGAKEEGFRTVCICKKENEIIYQRFSLADEIVIVKDFESLLDANVQKRLRELNTILIPHGSFNAYLDMDDILNKLEEVQDCQLELIKKESSLKS